MKTFLYCFLCLLFYVPTNGQPQKDKIGIFICGHRSGDTLSATDFLIYPFIAEVYNSFGFESVSETKRIKSYSVKIKNQDSVLLEEIVTGAYFTEKIKSRIKQQHNCCFQIEIYDIHIADKNDKDWAEQKVLTCFLR